MSDFLVVLFKNKKKKRIIKKQYHKYGLVNFFAFERFLTLVKEAIDPVSENAFYIEKDGDSEQCDIHICV